MDLPLQSVRQPDLGTLDGKVVKVFRIDAGEFSGDKLLAKVTGGGRGRGAGVAPTGKREDQHRAPERRPALEDKGVRAHSFYLP